ncbi:hypothetical protein ABVG11_37560 [Streptomyces sp. HD1123-B1]|uniref:hypothetical protein n=1 Tax=Streptomyces huangiella TaxID=3228804 RepID=UPI003D7E3CE9
MATTLRTSPGAPTTTTSTAYKWSTDKPCRREFTDSWDDGVTAVSEALVGIADRDWVRRGNRSRLLNWPYISRTCGSANGLAWSTWRRRRGEQELDGEEIGAVLAVAGRGDRGGPLGGAAAHRRTVQSAVIRCTECRAPLRSARSREASLGQRSAAKVEVAIITSSRRRRPRAS